MGSSLGTLLANIFMTSSEEEKFIPTLTSYLCNQKRYVDDTQPCVNPEKVDFILTKLNSYHPNIQFTFKLERNEQIKFLDALVKRTAADQIETCVYRKEASTDFYINLSAHAPPEWKIQTLRNLVRRAKTVCSKIILLLQEKEHPKTVFTGINKFPHQVRKQNCKSRTSSNTQIAEHTYKQCRYTKGSNNVTIQPETK